MEPIPRVSARVLPVCPDGEVLLLQDQDPTHPGVLRWGTNTWFALPLACDVEVSFEHLVPEEVGNALAWGWWAPDALAAEVGVVSDDLPELVAAAVDAVRRGAS